MTTFDQAVDTRCLDLCAVKLPQGTTVKLWEFLINSNVQFAEAILPMYESSIRAATFDFV